VRSLRIKIAVLFTALAVIQFLAGWWLYRNYTEHIDAQSTRAIHHQGMARAQDFLAHALDSLQIAQSLAHDVLDQTAELFSYSDNYVTLLRKGHAEPLQYLADQLTTNTDLDGILIHDADGELLASATNVNTDWLEQPTFRAPYLQRRSSSPHAPPVLGIPPDDARNQSPLWITTFEARDPFGDPVGIILIARDSRRDQRYLNDNAKAQGVQWARFLGGRLIDGQLEQPAPDTLPAPVQGYGNLSEWGALLASCTPATAHSLQLCALMPRSREQAWESDTLNHLGQAKHLLSAYLVGSAGFFLLAILITYLAANFYVVRPIRENTARLHRLLPHGDFPEATGDELALLHQVVTQTQELAREHQALSARIEFEAHHDDITPLPNRRALNEFIANLQNHSAVEPGVVLLHIRNFDRIQDQFGYRQADQALFDLSSYLDDDLPDNWYVFYLGHNRFLLIALGEPDLGGATRRLIDHVATDLTASACPAAALLDLEATYISSRDFNTDLSTLFQYAAITLHQNSEAPDRVFAVVPEQIARFHRQLLMESHLAQAVERNELYLHYQPICRSDDIGLRYFEVLLRWHNPALGEVSPACFIPIAETKGLIGDIGQWIFHQACAQLATWDLQEETRGICLSINVSPLQLGDANLASRLLDTLAEFTIPPRRLILEITESTALSLSSQARENLETLRKAGIQLAIDDFGEGYSSLGQLLRLNADILKIDRQFVATIDRDDSARAVIRGFIELARNLSMEIVAEGVENARQLELLRQNGCPGVQGYLVSRPLPPDLAIRWYLQICNFPADSREQAFSPT